MSRRFRRHSPCLDAALRRVFSTLSARPALRGAFTRLVAVAHARSDLLRDLPVSRDGRYLALEGLRNLAGHHRQFIADPFAWTGALGRHPLAIIHSLACHLLGRYPVPRFLASVWFGGDEPAERERRGWFVEHARGRRFRDLRTPVALTRRMEHALLHGPDHLSVDRALRRAEVIGLGGCPALADAVAACQLGSRFDRPALWRAVLVWLVSRGDEVDLAWLPRVINGIAVAEAEPALAGRSFEAVRRELARDEVVRAAPAAPRPARPARLPRVWQRSRWNEVTLVDGDTRWRVVELTDSTALVREGHALRHCVGGYAWRCVSGASRIWSLRQASADGEVSVLTIEVDPRTATVVQLRGRANQRATGQPLAMVRRWMARERLSPSARLEAELAAAAALATATAATATGTT